MKYRVVLCVCLLPWCVASTAQTMESGLRPYVSLKIGAAIPKDHNTTEGSDAFDNGMSFSGAVGVRLQPALRLELEGSFRRFDTDRSNEGGVDRQVVGAIAHQALLTNLYYDFQVMDAVRFHLGGGVGMGMADTRITALTTGANTVYPDARKRDYGFAYQLGSGLSIPLGEKWFTDIGYRFLVTHTDDDGLSMHEITAGLRYGY
ncbi:MAG: porin family protein [Magnetococcales bacterium]|nr:porin family protein [Magnetococcales bacterium]